MACDRQGRGQTSEELNGGGLWGGGRVDGLARGQGWVDVGEGPKPLDMRVD